jgi:hypothetical protein
MSAIELCISCCFTVQFGKKNQNQTEVFFGSRRQVICAVLTLELIHNSNYFLSWILDTWGKDRSTSMGVWQGVAMDSLKFHLGRPCLTPLPCGRAIPAAVFYPFAHRMPYTSVDKGRGWIIRGL